MAVMLSNNGAMPQYAAMETRPDVIYWHFRLTGNGTAAPVDKDADQLGCAIYSITRSSMGLYVIVPNRKFVGAIEGVEIGHVGTLDGARFKLTALNLATPTMTLRVTKPGGASLPAWATIAVAANTSGALPAAGRVVAVELSVGGVVGAGHLTSAAPAVTREVQVVYTAGVATLNFLAGDAVTEAKYILDPTAEAVVDIEAADSVYITLAVRTKVNN